jgi:hypothetical protein
MRIAFATEDFVEINDHLYPGGCAYYRCMLPKNAAGPLSAFGPTAWSGELGFGVRINKQQARFGFDTVVLKMLMARWVPEQMRMAQRLGQRLIVDVDDHYDGLHETNMAWETTHPEKNKIHNREHYREVIEQADVVTVSTPFLYDYYKDTVRNVVLIRNGINPNQFQRRKQRSTKPVLGWAGAMKWRSNDAQTAVPWLGEFLNEHDLTFHHAGHMTDALSFAEAAGIDPARVTTSPMRILTEYHEMLQFDIGVVLLSDIPFNHAKSTIKGLEYAASGIPFVAQDLPEYARLAEQGVGRVAHSAADWRSHLEDLLDYRTRKREAAVMRTLALEQHSIISRAPEWKQLFEGLYRFAPIKSCTIGYVNT